jgi:hypothetical protein
MIFKFGRIFKKRKGHVELMPADSLPRATTEYSPQRRRGFCRPRIIWKDHDCEYNAETI